MALGESDASRRRRPEPLLNEPPVEISCPAAVVALGYAADPSWEQTAPGLQRVAEGLFVVDDASGRTCLPNVFAGSDNVHGPDLVVSAVADGCRAAAAVSRDRADPQC
jgi:NADPH-dependent glutamate synthase beta subunit-like oxidoreductase